MEHVLKRKEKALTKQFVRALIVFGVRENYLFFSISACFMARTLRERPKRLMKPSASLWL